jgi:alpha-1,3-glucosyltransferase
VLVWGQLGTVSFCLALNYKQMTLYYAPAFFFYLLAKCYRTKACVPSATAAVGDLDSDASRSPLVEVSKLAAAVIGTFAICWTPFLFNPTDTYHG